MADATGPLRLSEGNFVVIHRAVVAALAAARGLGEGQEGHLVGDDLDTVAFDILVVGPAGVVDATAHHHLHALVDILFDGLADAVEAGDPVPFGILDPTAIIVFDGLAVAVPLGPRGREAEVGDLGAALGGAGFRRGADIAGEDDEVLDRKSTRLNSSH